MKDLSGTRLGRYELRDRLGRGGMAEVYRAYQDGMDRFVAVKLLLGHLSDDDAFIERFRREAQAVGRLRHPNIVNVFDFGIEDDIYYMVMEHLEGGTLKQRINRSKALSVTDALRVTDQIADALAYAHAADMIHRDLKPANVMFGSDPAQAILTDFGIARMLTESGLTTSGMMVGTPAYMSPEAGHGLPADERADIYALGIMLFEMLDGDVPYTADTPLAVVMKHVNGPLPELDHLDIPEEVQYIILRSMAKKPEDRFQTAIDMRDAVRDARVTIDPTMASGTRRTKAPVMLDEATSIVPTPLPSPAVSAAPKLDPTMVDDVARPPIPPTQPGEDRQTQIESPSRKRRSWVTFAAIGVVLLLIAGGIFAAIEGSSDDGAEDEQSVVSGDETPLTTEPDGPDENDNASTELTRTQAAQQDTQDAATRTVDAFNTQVAEQTSTETPEPEPTDIPDEPTVVAGAGDNDDPDDEDNRPGNNTDQSIRRMFEFEGISLIGTGPREVVEMDVELLEGNGETALQRLDVRVADRPDSVQTLTARSMLRVLTYDIDGAIADAERATELDEDDWFAWLALTDAYYAANRMDEMNEALVMAYDIEPDHPEVLWRIARAEANAFSNIQTGFEFLDEAIDREASGFRFVNFAASLYFDNGYYEESLLYSRVYLNATALHEFDETPFYRLATAMILSDEVQELYELAIQRAAERDLSPYDLGAYAYIPYRVADYVLADEWIDNAVEAAGQDESPPTASFAHGLVSIEFGELDDAEDTFNELVSRGEFQVFPFFLLTFGHDARLRLAQLLVDLEDREQDAIEPLVSFLGDNSGYAPAYLLLGDAYESIGATDDARTAYKTGYEFLYDDLNQAELRSEFRQNLVDLEFGENAVDVSYQPREPQFEIDDAPFDLLSGLTRLQDEIDQQVYIDEDPSGALTRLYERLDRDPENADTLAAVAMLLIEYFGNTEEGLGYVEDAIEFHPDRVNTWVAAYTYATHWSVNDWERAAEAIENGLALQSDNPELLWRQATVDLRNGNYGLASQNFEAAREEGAKGVRYADQVRGYAWGEGDLQYALDATLTVHLAAPQRTDVTLELLNLLLIMDKTEDALNVAYSVQPYADIDPHLYNALAYVALKAGENDAALAFAQSASVLSPDTRPLNDYVLGLVYGDGFGQYQEAIARLEATEFDDEDVLINNTNNHLRNYDLARMYYADDQPQTALDLLLEGISQREWFVPYYLLAAEITRGFNDFETALGLYESALEFVQDDNTEQRDAIEALIEETTAEHNASSDATTEEVTEEAPAPEAGESAEPEAEEPDIDEATDEGPEEVE